jgi:hypothetical protein
MALPQKIYSSMEIPFLWRPKSGSVYDENYCVLLSNLIRQLDFFGDMPIIFRGRVNIISNMVI